MELFSHEEKNGLLIVTLEKDRLDAAVSEGFKEALKALIAQGKNRIVLDLSEIAFMDSSGLGALISVLKKVGPGGDLVLCGAGEMVQKLFTLTRMHKVFRQYDSVADAVTGMSG